MEHETITTTTIDPSVLYSIVRLTTLETPGVSQLSPVSFGISKLAQDNLGIKVDIQESKLYIDVYIITKINENVRLVSETVQSRIIRAITDMVGMEVVAVDVHVTDIDLKAD